MVAPGKIGCGRLIKNGEEIVWTDPWTDCKLKRDVCRAPWVCGREGFPALGAVHLECAIKAGYVW